jgi:hypothetical protein
MGRRARAGRWYARAAWPIVALALTVPALAYAAVTPDAGDAPASAQGIEALPGKASELIDHPGDQDWYTIAGRNADDSVNAVFVRVLQTTPTCGQPLKVALFNPEGRWMRSTQAGAGHVGTVLVPGFPSRYALDVSAIDPGCAGLEYEVTYVSTDPPKPDSAAGACIVAHAKRMDRADRLKLVKDRKPGYTPTAQKRYDGYISAAKRSLGRARTVERHVCK